MAFHKLNRSLKIAYEFGNKDSLEYSDIPNTKPNFSWVPSTNISDDIDTFTNRAKETVISHVRRHGYISKADRRIADVLRNLFNNPNIIIKEADKNLGLVVLDRQKYIDMCYTHIKDTNTYKLCSDYDPRNIFQELELILFRYGHDSNSALYKSLMQDCSSKDIKPCAFYCLPKIHKNKIPIPGRPIASAMNTISYYASKYIDNILKPLIPKLSTIVSSTDQFIKLKIPKSVNSDMVILCADVASLYPSIPTQFGLRRINELLTFHFLWPREKIDLTLEILNWILTNNYVEFNGIYKQVKGTAMGTPAAPVYSNLVLFTIESPILSYLQSCVWYARFIDDVCACMKYEDALTFIKEFNNVCPDIKFEAITIEKKGIFLDLEINLRDSSASSSLVEYRLYQKPINKFLYISPLSNHPEHVHMSWIEAEIQRIKARCSDPNDADLFIAEFKKRLKARGHEIPTPDPNPNQTENPNYNPNPIDGINPIGTPIRPNAICRLIINEPNCYPKIKWSSLLRLPQYLHDIFYWEYDRQGIQVVVKNDRSIGKIVTRSRFKP